MRSVLARARLPLHSSHQRYKDVGRDTKCHRIIVSSNSATRAPPAFSLSFSVYRCSHSPMFPRPPLVSLLSDAAHALHALVELAPPSRGLAAPQSAASPHLTRPFVRPSSRLSVSLSCRVRPRIAGGQRSVRRRVREAALRAEGSVRRGEWPAWATEQGSWIMRWKCGNTQTHKHNNKHKGTTTFLQFKKNKKQNTHWQTAIFFFF